MTLMQIRCSGDGPHDPGDGVLGEADRDIAGMLCLACVAAIPVLPTAPDIDIVTLANNLAALTNAVDDLILDALGRA